MDARSVFKPFAVLFLLVTATYIAHVNTTDDSPTLDEDRDALTNVYNMLSSLAHSLVDVDNEIKSRETTTSEDVKNLTNAQARMDYEVKVMRVEHEAELLAGKRSEVTDERGEKISAAETELRDTLEPAIKETEANLSKLNETMKAASLSGDEMDSLLEQANSIKLINQTEGEGEDEKISVPKPSDIMSNVTTEIAIAEKIVQRRTREDQLDFINKKLKTVKDSFQEMLAADPPKKFDELAALSKKIDSALVQIRHLDLLDTQVKMEL